jgi:fructose-specific phosphotransferase system component IIB
MQLDTLIEKGMNIPKPSYDLILLPPDITLLSSEQLAEMFTVLTGWADYTASRLAQGQIEERAAQRALDLKVNTLMVEKLGSATKSDKVTLIRAQIAIDDNVIKLEDRLEEKHAYRKMVEMMLSNQERDITLVSREITRRTAAGPRRDFA